MATGLTPEDTLYQWAVRKFAGEDIPERIIWDSSLPDRAEADHLPPGSGEPGTVRLTNRKRGLFGLLPGRKLTIDELWYRACFELHNIQGTPDSEQADRLAGRSELTRDGYIRQHAYKEYQALLRTRAFYVDFYFPWARAKKIETDPEEWRLDLPSFEGWIAQYYDHSSYPWVPYGGYYDDLQKRKDVAKQLQLGR